MSKFIRFKMGAYEEKLLDDWSELVNKDGKTDIEREKQASLSFELACIVNSAEKHNLEPGIYEADQKYL